MPSRREYFLPLLAVVLPAVRETMAFAPVSYVSTTSQTRVAHSVACPRQYQRRSGSGAGGALDMAIDPHEAITHAHTVADLSGAAADHVASNVESAFTTLSTAASSVVVPIKEKYAWEFLWWHGDKVGHVNPLGEDVSIPPGFNNPNAAPMVKDYFLPEDPKAAAEAIHSQKQAASSSAIGGIDSSQLRDSSFGGRPEVFFDTPLNPSIKQLPMTDADLDEVLHDADIMSRLPMLAFASVLIDFFFFNSGNDVYRDEIETDEEALRAEWVSQVVPRVAIGVLVAMVTIWSSYTFYHPIPGL